MLCKWEELPDNMQNDAVKPYYDILNGKKADLFAKRVFDVIVSALSLIVLSPIFLVVAVIIKLDSHGPVFYRQQRVTRYGKLFVMHKFRTMEVNSDKESRITRENDSHITKAGKTLRRLKIDELAQLIDVFSGNMTFVGTRPEVPEFTAQYSDEMFATLLLPAGITSKTSILFKDEARFFTENCDPGRKYVEQILPCKMKYNLAEVRNFGFFNDIKTMFKTVFAVLGLIKTDDTADDRELVNI